MILGVGTDLVGVARIADVLARHGDRFITRVFAPVERVYAADDAAAPAHYAKRWAAKEAVAKAMGLGIDRNVFLKDIIVDKGENGAPILRLEAGAAARARALNNREWPRFFLSLSDDSGFALAFVVIESSPA